VKGPDKGSFPLDHFHECDKDAKKYNDCLSKH
jgi:cytochrome c oxidase assembly protein subunit 19